MLLHSYVLKMELTAVVTCVNSHVLYYITVSHKIKPLAFVFDQKLPEQSGGIKKNSPKNTFQGIWHAKYAHSFIVLPPQIFVAR